MDDLPADDCTIRDGADFAARWLPVFAQGGGPGAEDLAKFTESAYAEGLVLVFDWPEWRDQGHVLLETSGAMERTSFDDLRRLLTLLLRQERFAEGTMAHAVEQGWMHRILDRMATVCGGAPA